MGDRPKSPQLSMKQKNARKNIAVFAPAFQMVPGRTRAATKFP
jgi:hypothetical protein